MDIHIIFGILFILCIIFIVFSAFFNIRYQKREFIILSVIFIFIFIIFAYTFNPPEHFDLYRYFLRMEKMQGKTIEYSNVYGPYSANPTINTLMHMVGQTGNFNLLSPISILLIFSIVTVVSYKILFKTETPIYNSSYNLYLFLVISVLGVSILLSGVRQNLAWSFLLLAVYYDFFGSKTNNLIRILLYIFPITIHSSAVIIVVLRILNNFIRRYPFSSLVVLFWPFGITFLEPYSTVFPEGIKLALDKLNIYMSLDIQNDYTTLFLPLLYLILILLTMYLIVKGEIKKNGFITFYISILLFGMSTITISTLPSRILDFIILISLPIIISLYKLKPSVSLVIKSVLIGLGVVMLVVYDYYLFTLIFR